MTESRQKRVAIIGAGGRLGAALCRAYAGDFGVLAFRHQGLDIGDLSCLRETLASASFDLLINCAAQTNVDRCETESTEAFRLNGEAPGVMAEVCTARGAKMIHISTDYVFAGEKTGAYSEEDEAHPISVYGASKLEGEKRVAQVDRRHVIARVSWVFGPDRPSFIDAIIKRAREENEVAAIDNKRSTPSYTLDLALLLRAIALNEAAAGIIHITNTGACSWREYAQHALNCCAEAGISLKTQTVGALLLSDMKNFIARRPPNTILSTAKLQRLTGITPRPWQAAVADFVRRHIAQASV